MKKFLFFLVLCLFLSVSICENNASGSAYYPINDVTLEIIDGNEYYRWDDLDSLYVGFEVIYSPNPTNHDATSYIMFDLTSIPDSHLVTNAQLHMYCDYDINDLNSLDVDVYRVADDSWTESTIFPDSPPGHDDSILSTQSVNGTGWYTWDITSTWNPGSDLSDNYLSLVLTYDSASDMVGFTSSEGGSNRLYLDIQAEAVPIPGAVWLLGSGLIGLIGFRRKFVNRQ